jgi:4-hydroxy-tetrahydrodipicolinate reductase
LKKQKGFGAHKMKIINLAISGCMGKMGQQLIKSSNKDKSFKLTALTENRVINKKIGGIKPDLNNEDVFRKVDVIIDFTIPKCTLEILKIASKLKKKLLLEQRVFQKKKKL